MFFVAYTPDLIRILMNASSVTARILSLAVLLLSLAPLGSMYVLFFSIFGGGDTTISSGGLYETNDALHAVLKNPNATLDDLWTAVFETHPMPPGVAVFKAALQQQQQQISGGGANNNSIFAAATALEHHIPMVIPWIISMLLGLLVPCLLSIANCRNQQQRRQQRQQQQHRHRNNRVRENWTPTQEKKILTKLRHRLEPYTMQLEQVVVLDDDDGKSSSWRIPSPGVPLPSTTASQQQVEEEDDAHTEVTSDSTDGSTNSFRSIADDACCGICLEELLWQQQQAVVPNNNTCAGEAPTSSFSSSSITWSSNPKCSHVYHAHCIQTWLLRTYKYNQIHACPSCRQVFLLNKKRMNTSRNERRISNFWR